MNVFLCIGELFQQSLSVSSNRLHLFTDGRQVLLLTEDKKMDFYKLNNYAH